MKLVNQDSNKVRYNPVGTAVFVGLPDFTEELRLPLQLLGVSDQAEEIPKGRAGAQPEMVQRSRLL